MSRRISHRSGYRVIVPYLRGYGTTRFFPTTPSATASRPRSRVDIIALMDALKIDKARHRRFRLGRAHGQYHRGAVAGALQGAGLRQRLSDRQPGRRTRRRCRRRPNSSGGINFTSPPNAAGPATRNTATTFNKLIWQTRLAEMEFRRRHVRPHARHRSTIPDHVAIVIHNYRWRLGLADGEAKYDDLEKRLADASGHHRADHHHGRRRQRRAASGARAPIAKKFSGKYAHRIITGGIGHNLPQEAPQAFAEAIIDADRM